MVEADYKPVIDDKPFMLLSPEGDTKHYSFDEISEYIREK